jgi:ADP-ribosylglycohydrolase
MSRLIGTLLGTALGDALGLPVEGMSPELITRRYGRVDRFRLLGRTGFVSDDTEQSALVAQSLARFPGDPTRAAAAFRRSLIGWFLRLPYGIGFATLRACIHAALGLRPSGVRSAGNGAAMRSAIIGAFFLSDREKVRAFGVAFAEVTHTDPRAVDGALFVAAMASECARSFPGESRLDMFDRAVTIVGEPSLVKALMQARQLAVGNASLATARELLQTSGFIVHTAPFATFCFLRFQASPLETLAEVIAAGGDTDSIAAIVGAWLGALFGEAGLPADLIGRIHDGPFGPTHLRKLGQRLETGRGPVPRYSAGVALLRNLLLFPVILAHGFRRLLPL